MLAVFFLGLAWGSEVFGRRSARAADPLGIYAVLEIALAVLALLGLAAFDLVDHVHASAVHALGPESAALWPIRIALIAAVLLPPTFLMGGTLPLFARRFARHEDRIAGAIGGLYAVNTLGAALGCALAGFVLVPAIGVRATVIAAAALNLLAGLTVIGLRTSRVIAPDERAPRAVPASARAHARWSRRWPSSPASWRSATRCCGRDSWRCWCATRSTPTP